jgi:CheY-like chemotaxis protein
MFVKILHILGFEITEAENGQEALTQAEAFRPDLILMDLRMPRMNGFEATQQLRLDPQLKDIIVIAISASVFTAVRQESLAAGCDDFLTKPVQLDDLLDCLRVHLKLDWTYNVDSTEDTASAPEQEPLHPPSQDTLQELFALAMRGDVTLLQERAQELAASPPETTAFGTRLYDLAKALQIDAIQEFLAEFMESER